MARVTSTLGAMGQSLIGLSASDLKEVRFDAAGASSTMPQKQNPVAASSLVALSGRMAGLTSSLHIAAQHQHQRDGAAWFTEWMVLPEIMLTGASALDLGKNLSTQITPNLEHMDVALSGLGLIHAEALSFALTEHMPRPDAQDATKALCAQAQDTGLPLSQVARDAYPDIDPKTFEPRHQMGDSTAAAHRFAALVKAL